MDRAIAAARALQQASLLLLLVLLPVSKAGIEILFFLLLIGWLLERALCGGWTSSVWSQRAMRPMLLALLGYLAVCAASIFTSTYPALSLRGFIGKTLEYALFLVILADVVARMRTVWPVVAALLTSAVIVISDALVQEVTGVDPILHHSKIVFARMTGPYENPGDLATYLMVMLLVTMALLSRQRGRWGKALAGVMILLLGGCLVRTEAQPAWIGYAIGMLVIFLFDPSLRRVLVGFGVSLYVAAAAVLHAKERLGLALTLSVVGVSDRVFMWKTAWHMFLNRPLLGQGLNTFMANYLAYYVGGEQTPRYAHNCYLQTAAETGVLGLALFLAVLVCFFVSCAKALRERRSDEPALLLGLTAGLLAFVVQAGADTNFYALRQAALFWSFAGCALGLTMRNSMNAIASSGTSAGSHH